MAGFFRFILLIFLGIMIYNLIRFVVFLIRNSRVRSNDNIHDNGSREFREKFERKKEDKNSRVIELDKDQYKVE